MHARIAVLVVAGLSLQYVVSGFSRTVAFSSQNAGNQPTDGGLVFDRLCASCHGQRGAGGRASALVDNRRVRAMSGPEIENVVRNGTPNGMPPFAGLSAIELQSVVAFVRSLSPVASESAGGDIRAGEALFFGKGKCASCHIAVGRGAAIGPDLSNVGRQMTPAELMNALVEPNASIAQGYALARVEFKDGRSVRGFIRNEGNHVLPLQDLTGRLLVVDKRQAAITREPGSIMPPLDATAEERRDLIAFLGSLNGSAPLVPLAAASAPIDVAELRRDKPVAPRNAFDEILNPRAGDWPTYHGRLDGNRHSALAQITTGNVRQLSLQWVHSVRGFGQRNDAARARRRHVHHCHQSGLRD